MTPTRRRGYPEGEIERTNRQASFRKSLCDKESGRTCALAFHLWTMPVTPIVNQNPISRNSIHFLLFAVLKCVYSFVVLGLTCPGARALSGLLVRARISSCWLVGTEPLRVEPRRVNLEPTAGSTLLPDDHQHPVGGLRATRVGALDTLPLQG